jgi:two-component system sensor histidine kinase KdpD
MKDVFPALSGFAWLHPKALWQRHLLALAAVSLTILLARPLHTHLDLANTAMLFLLTVVLVAVKLGRRPAILTAFCSVASFNFFFVPPFYSFTVNNIQYLVTFTVMLVVALTITHLTAGLRKQAEDASTREQQTMSLYQLEKVAQETRLQMASERLRSSILSALSHDIRTPLTSLSPPIEFHLLSLLLLTPCLCVLVSAKSQIYPRLCVAQ